MYNRWAFSCNIWLYFFLHILTPFVYYIDTALAIAVRVLSNMKKALIIEALWDTVYHVYCLKCLISAVSEVAFALRPTCNLLHEGQSIFSGWRSKLRKVTLFFGSKVLVSLCEEVDELCKDLLHHFLPEVFVLFRNVVSIAEERLNLRKGQKKAPQKAMKKNYYLYYLF